MTQDFERISVPPGGTAVEYEGEFVAPEAPIIPFSPGVDEEIVSATRRMLDAAAEEMGRTIHWMRVYAGDEARARYGDPLPDETVRAFRQFRLGLVGTLADERADALVLERDLRRRLDVTTAVTRCSNLEWQPSPTRTTDLDVTLFRDVSEDVAAGLEYGPESDSAATLRACLRRLDGAERVPDEPTGYSVSPLSQRATEALVDDALEYAFEHDHSTVTVAHQGDLRPGSEGSFLQWARDYLDAEYGDSVVDEATFRAEYHGFPDDELVVFERRTDALCRELLVDPAEYDTVLSPALGGTYLSAVAATAAGEVGGSADVGLGDGRLLVSSHASGRSTGTATAGENPIPLLLAGCLLFDTLGWEDAASTVRTAVSATLADGILPRDLFRQRARGEPVTAAEFADEVLERLTDTDGEPGAGGVRTTPDERAAIKGSIAALYSAVFEDSLAPEEIELNQLLGEDEEADVYLPEVGLNFYYWRRWSVERRLEVLLHELAHVEEEPGERDHGEEFYERLVELTEIAADWKPELEAAFGEGINFGRVRRFVVESVHEETIEPDLETVTERKQWLREQFGLERADYY